MARPATPLMDRIESAVARIPESGCWIWMRGLNRAGYGEIKVRGKTSMAHRVVYEALAKPIPETLCLDHKCRVRCCVNPDHLEPVTLSENARRGIREPKGRYNRLKQHCPRGHEYSGDNLILSFKQNGGVRRHCKACRKLRIALARRNKS